MKTLLELSLNKINIIFEEKGRGPMLRLKILSRSLLIRQNQVVLEF